MTSHRIGVNLRVSGNCDQGARKYMEDNHVIKFLKKDTDDYEFAYFGIFDGHGGPEASAFCKDNLLNEITKYDGFWTDDDEQVLAAVRKGFLDTHNAMWKVLDSWPKTVTGLPSTAGSTATIAIIKQGKLYTGHVGDSALVLGENRTYSGDEFAYQANCITKEHKPDDPDERLRIEDAGGEVMSKSGVPRVVWSRPKTNHKGPVRRSTHIDQIPFLAVARSLGDLWSYDYYTETYVVSPDPDVSVMKLDPIKHRCLILASDGLWNMLTPEETVSVVMDLETQFEQKIISDPSVSLSFWSNPAERLVFRALNKWKSKSLKADNTSCVVVLIDPLGPSKLTLLKQKRQALLSGGEITAQLNKVHKLIPESDHRNKAHNKNENCCLSESHIRPSDDSILQRIADKEQVGLPVHGQSDTATSKPEYKSSEDDCYKMCLNKSAQPIVKPHLKWNLRHSMENETSVNSNKSNSNHNATISVPLSQNLSSPESLCSKSGMVFTKLIQTSRATNGETESKYRMNMAEQMQQFNCPYDIIHEDFVACGENSIEIEENKVDSDIEELHSKLNVNKSDEDIYQHSSPDVSSSSKTLTSDLLSDERMKSPESFFVGDNHLLTTQNVASKLSSSRTRRSNTAKKKLQHTTKPLLGIRKISVSSLASKSATSLLRSSSTITEAAENFCSKTGAAKISTHDNRIRNEVTKVVDYPSVAAKDFLIKTQTNHNQMISLPKRAASLQQQAMNLCRSENVTSPKNHKQKLWSLSCANLSPGLRFCVPEVSKSALNSRMFTCTTNNVRGQLISSVIAAADTLNLKTTFRPRFRKEVSMKISNRNVLLESSVLAQTEHFKQLNKTGPIRKIASKRWVNCLHISKQGIDKMPDGNSHRKSTANIERASAGILVQYDNSQFINNKITLSASKQNDSNLTIHMPDLTVSHHADLTVNTPTVAVGGLTNLSEDNSMFASAELTTIHHRMLDKSMPRKISKQRKGLLQNSKASLRRVSKSVHKSFLPENDRFLHKSTGRKRRNSVLYTTLDMKRRKQLDTTRN